MPYANPYAGGGPGVGGGGGDPGAGQAQPANVPASNAPAANTAPIDYSQPLNTAAAPPDALPGDPATTPAAQAHQAFQTGDYLSALKLTNQALGQMPNDVNLHQFLALDLFAQGNYEQAAAPLYAVLSVGPGWNWTTLIGNYSDADAYTQQLRGLEAFVKANPKSAKAQFVLAYQYICQGQGEAAIKPLKNVVALQPTDKLSAQLLAMLQAPTAATAPAN
jgi:cytochrome c-type biogenesis protein CcmH/NrfG